MHSEQLTDQALRQAPRCAYGAGQFMQTANAVYFLGKDKDGNELPPQWLCSLLKVSAKTRSQESSEWGRLLEWQDDDGQPHQWAVPLEALEGDGIDVRRELARQGLPISPSRNARDLVSAYIKLWPVEARACCVDRLGWHGSVYVGVNRAYGGSAERHIYQNAHAIPPAMQLSGSLQAWQSEVAAPAANNSRLILAICAALAGPLVRVADEESGGFHLRGQSSFGKSTALQVAASVWGKPSDYVRTWRSTANALEGQASLHNDGLLILDEISQINPEEAGEAAYLLANGQGKGRATKIGTARPVMQWKLLFLSAGELSLADQMAKGRKRSTAGQEIRLADIPADAGAGLGLFECLHRFDSAAELAQSLKQSAAKCHGYAGDAWLEYLSENWEGMAETLQARIGLFAGNVTPTKACGQVMRVARRFGLLAAAGELANQTGLTGWPEGAANSAITTCFNAWLDNFGGAENHEEREIVKLVLGFLEAHGNSRFESIHGPADPRIPNRAGFFRTKEMGPEFLLPTASFDKEICPGFDKKLVKQTLIKAGILVPGSDGKPTQQARLPGLVTNTRVYVLRYPNTNA